MTRHNATWGHPPRPRKPPFMTRFGWWIIAAAALLLAVWLASIAAKATAQAMYDATHFQEY